MSAIALRTPKDVQKLRAQIRTLPSVNNRIAQRGAEEFSRLSKAAFDAKMTPGGEPWRAGKGGNTPTLKKTGQLEAAATRFYAQGPRIIASVGNVVYARFQVGRGFMPTRALPAAWLKVLREIATEEISKHLREQ